ncbi:MAG: bifunctional metallophosphatase/5'-nucleotidase [Desulfobulbus sp.]|nr:bifunctional metallophosphatase/5'-nucleotidase [Desulfobulbus sp.]
MRIPLLGIVALLAALLVLDSGQSEAAEHPLPPAELTLIHANDVYEIQPVEGGRFGGPARVATVIAALKQAGTPVLATLGGDYLSPSALGTARVDGQPLAGRQMVEVLGAMGLEWTTLGNHEFDVSEARFRAHLGEAKFGIVAANVVGADGQPFAGVVASTVVPVQAGERTLRIGLVGLTMDANRKDWVRYRDPIASARAEVAKLQGKTDAIVALTHLSLAQDSSLATAVPGIDLILGGHEHENWQIFRGPGFMPIVKADANFRSVAIVTLRFAAAGTRPTVTTRLQLIDESIPTDPTVAALADRWTEVGFAAFRRDGFTPERVIAVTDEPLDGLEATVRNRPGRLTALIAQAMLREAKGADAAVFNGGSVRIDDVLPAGPVTEYDILRILPFGGRVVAATLDGALLTRVLDTGVHNQGLGGYLHSASITWENGVWQVGGKPVDPAGRYRVALTDFLLSGGEVNLGFLTRDNPQVRDVVELRDIRRVLIEELAATWPKPAEP